MGFNGLAVELRLLGVRSENHNHISPGRSLRGRVDGQPFLFGFGAGSATFRETNADRDAAIAQVQRVGVALRPVTNDGDLFRLNEGKVRRIVVIKISHAVPLVGRCTAESLMPMHGISWRRPRSLPDRTCSPGPA